MIKLLKKIILYIFLILILSFLSFLFFSGSKIYDRYQAIINFTAKDLSTWLKQNNYNNIAVDIKNIKLDWRAANLYFNLDHINLKFKNNNNFNNKNNFNIIKIKNLTGKINIFTAILYSKIKIKNLIFTQINLVINDINQKIIIPELIGDIDLFLDPENKNIIKNNNNIKNINNLYININLSDITQNNINFKTNIKLDNFYKFLEFSKFSGNLKLFNNNFVFNINNNYLLIHYKNIFKAKILLNQEFVSEFSIEELFLLDHNLGKIKIIIPKSNNLLYFKNFNSSIIGSISITEHGTQISGEADSKYILELFKQFNLNQKLIQNGKGIISFDVQLPKNLATLEQSLNNLNCTFNLNIQNGIIIGLNPGLGRIIGLLNIDNIKRRLQLDFKDVTNTGFTFDTLTGKLELTSESLQIEPIIIKGPSAKIVITGKINLDTENLDLFMEISSKLAGTLPIAAAIAAGNPVIGAAIWLFDKVSGTKVGELKAKKYKITGTWETPEVLVL